MIKSLCTAPSIPARQIFCFILVDQAAATIMKSRFMNLGALVGNYQHPAIIINRHSSKATKITKNNLELLPVVNLTLISKTTIWKWVISRWGHFVKHCFLSPKLWLLYCRTIYWYWLLGVIDSRLFCVCVKEYEYEWKKKKKREIGDWNIIFAVQLVVDITFLELIPMLVLKSTSHHRTNQQRHNNPYWVPSKSFWIFHEGSFFLP